MKRAILSVGLFLLMAATAIAAPASNIDLTKGTVVSKTLPGLTLHTYVSPAELGMFTAQALESADGIVLVDVYLPGQGEAEFNSFVKSLNKPVKAILLTWGGKANWVSLISYYPTVPLYGLEHVITDLMTGEPKADHVTPTVLKEGENTIAGIKMQIVRPLPNVAAVTQLVALTDQKAAILYGLGAVGVHMPMSNGMERNVVLKALHDNGFTWFVPKNGMPGGLDALGIMGNYNATLDLAIKKSKTPEEAAKTMIEAYPDWAAQEGLRRLLPVVMAIGK